MEGWGQPPKTVTDPSRRFTKEQWDALGEEDREIVAKTMNMGPPLEQQQKKQPQEVAPPPKPRQQPEPPPEPEPPQQSPKTRDDLDEEIAKRQDREKFNADVEHRRRQTDSAYRMQQEDAEQAREDARRERDARQQEREAKKRQQEIDDTPEAIAKERLDRLARERAIDKRMRADDAEYAAKMELADAEKEEARERRLSAEENRKERRLLAQMTRQQRIDHLARQKMTQDSEAQAIAKRAKELSAPKDETGYEKLFRVSKEQGGPLGGLISFFEPLYKMTAAYKNRQAEQAEAARRADLPEVRPYEPPAAKPAPSKPADQPVPPPAPQPPSAESERARPFSEPLPDEPARPFSEPLRSDSASSRPPEYVTVACTECGGQMFIPRADVGKTKRCPQCEFVGKQKGSQPDKSRPSQPTKSDTGEWWPPESTPRQPSPSQSPANAPSQSAPAALSQKPTSPVAPGQPPGKPPVPPAAPPGGPPGPPAPPAGADWAGKAAMMLPEIGAVLGAALVAGKVVEGVGNSMLKMADLNLAQMRNRSEGGPHQVSKSMELEAQKQSATVDWIPIIGPMVGNIITMPTKMAAKAIEAVEEKFVEFGKSTREVSRTMAELGTFDGKAFAAHLGEVAEQKIPFLGTVIHATTDNLLQMNEATKATAHRLGAYNARLAEQVAHQEVRELMREISRAGRFGDVTAAANDKRFEMEQKWADITDRFVPFIMKISEKIFAVVERGLSGIDETLKLSLTVLSGLLQAVQSLPGAAAALAAVGIDVAAIQELIRQALANNDNATLDNQWNEFLGMDMGGNTLQPFTPFPAGGSAIQRPPQ